VKIFKAVFLVFFASYQGLPHAFEKTVVIDPGHEPSKSGAKGACGIAEVIYNDLMAKKIITVLSSYSVLSTRQMGQDIEVTDDLLKEVPEVSKRLWVRSSTLMARPAIANKRKADVLISIHHDSVSKKHQLKRSDLCDGKGGISVADAFRNRYKIGFNVFVNNEAHEPIRSRSILLGKLIGKAMISMGRTPSDYHFYPVDDCRSCEPVDSKLGVWHQDLAILRHAKMPAILIEVGNIVDHKDESLINNDEFRLKFSEALKSALNEYFSL
jgi:N-acetylmuramoyl-L-alanine amidase